MLYGVAIASVVILFKVVTNYGEANLQAHPNINGRYRLIGAKLPPCFQAKPVILTIQQSGVYLNGNLSNVETKTNSSLKEKLPLKGKWQNQQLQLSGLLPAKQICESLLAQSPTNDNLLVNIQADLPNYKPEENSQIKGQITIDKLGEKLDFTTQSYSVDSNSDSNPH